MDLINSQKQENQTERNRHENNEKKREDYRGRMSLSFRKPRDNPPSVTKATAKIDPLTRGLIKRRSKSTARTTLTPRKRTPASLLFIVLSFLFVD